MKTLVTGAAGFIGFHLARRLLAHGHEVVGYDGITPYYDVRLKRARLALLAREPGFRFVEGMLEDAALLHATVAQLRPQMVFHFAAQAGVRYSLEQPLSYLSANLTGLFNLLDALRQGPPQHLLFASSSSVYGANTAAPFRETDRTDFPLSIYAASKRGGEAMTHSYAHLFGIPTTALRLFTVYGPWGRPDMAAIKFASAIDEGRPIEIFGDGRMHRDFTYVADVIEAVVRLGGQPPRAGAAVSIEDSISPAAPWRVVNVAGGHPLELHAFIGALERALGRTAARIMLPMQPGDVRLTHADTTLLEALVGYVPATSLDSGLVAFADWYSAEWRRFSA
ncbi:MAG: NAD-dependent epimerase/dehydratase family protein [Devosia sp.]